MVQLSQFFPTSFTENPAGRTHPQAMPSASPWPWPRPKTPRRRCFWRRIHPRAPASREAQRSHGIEWWIIIVYIAGYIYNSYWLIVANRCVIYIYIHIHIYTPIYTYTVHYIYIYTYNTHTHTHIYIYIHASEPPRIAADHLQDLHVAWQLLESPNRGLAGFWTGEAVQWSEWKAKNINVNYPKKGSDGLVP